MFYTSTNKRIKKFQKKCKLNEFLKFILYFF